MSRYNPEIIARLTPVVTDWQHGIPIRSRDALEFNTLVTNISNDRWNAHYGKGKRDWVGTKCIREEVPLAFLEYLKYRRSVRLAGMKCCPLDEPHYSTLMYTMYAFRRQFPRIISVLTANHVGITLLKDYEPRTIPYMVSLPIYTELHQALCIMRKLASESGTRLYGPQRHEIRQQVLLDMYSSKGTKLPALTNKVLQRRMMAINAASDILASRSLAHHNARKDGSISDHFNKNNTNMEY